MGEGDSTTALTLKSVTKRVRVKNCQKLRNVVYGRFLMQQKRQQKRVRRESGNDCMCIFLNEDKRVNSFAKHYLISEKSIELFSIVLLFENQITLHLFQKIFDITFLS